VWTSWSTHHHNSLQYASSKEHQENGKKTKPPLIEANY